MLETTNPDLAAAARDPDPSSPRRGADRHARLVLIVACLLVALPFVVEAIRVLAIRGGYATASDLSIFESRIRDIPRHPPLTGVFSRYGWNHPGPFPYWVFLPFYWVAGRHPLGLALGSLAINAASAVGIVVVVRRRGGTVLVAWTALLLALFVRALGPLHWTSSWNPYVSLLPFALFLVLAWSLAVGDLAVLPWLAASGSFVVASHVGYVPIVAAVTGVALVSAWLRRRSQPAAPVGVSRATYWWTAAVLVFAWWGPVVDVAAHKGGNVKRLVRYFRHAKDRVGLRTAVKVVGNELSVRAQWLRGLVRNPFTAEPASIYRPGFPILLVAAAVVAVVVVRARPRDAGRLALVGIVALVVATASMASITGTAYDYLAIWALAIGFFLAVALGALVVGSAEATGVTRRSGAGRVVAGMTFALLGASALVAGFAARDAARSPDPSDAGAHAVIRLVDVLARRPDLRNATITFEPINGLEAGLVSDGFVLETERRGLHPIVARSDGYVWGAHRTGDVGAAHRFGVSVVPVPAQVPPDDAHRTRVLQVDELSAPARKHYDAFAARAAALFAAHRYADVRAMGPVPHPGLIITLYALH